MVENSKETNEYIPPAKAQKQLAHSDGSESNDIRVKCGYASEIFQRQYLNEHRADVFFTFDGSSDRVPAHKFILSLASTVFDQMFYGSSAVGSGDMPIVGYSPEVFKDFLQFFYLDEITLTQSRIKDVLRLLHVHKMSKCLEICGQHWIEKYNGQNLDDICFVFECAINAQMDKLRTVLERKISIHCNRIFKSDDFRSCSFDVLDRILEFDSLLCKESTVLGACLDWARHKCIQNGKNSNNIKNLREFLTNRPNSVNLLHKICYGSIGHVEFLVRYDAYCGLFADAKEREDVMRLVLGSKHSKTGKFRTVPRKPLWFDDYGLKYMFSKNRYPDEYMVIEQQLVYNLKTNKAILFGGFYIVKITNGNGQLRLSIKEQRNDGDLRKTIYTEWITVNEMSNHYVQLKPNPVHMNPYFEYRIEFDFESDEISFLDEVDLNKCTFRRDHLYIQIEPENDVKVFLMKGFKFIPM